MRSEKDGRSYREKTAEFIRQKGFYLVLLCCLAVVGVTAFVTFAHAGSDDGTQQVQQSDDETLQEANQSNDETLQEAQSAAATPASVPTPPASMVESATPTPSPSPAVSPSSEPEDESDTAAPKEDKLMFAPVEGEVLTAFADDTLLYSKTLRQWTSHKGLDIAAAEGTAVRAVADGVVDSVENDVMMGYTITISHENSVKSVYANLDALPKLTAGDSVKAGSEIGAVGASAIAESADPPHLHFELYVDGVAADPLPYIRGLVSIPVK